MKARILLVLACALTMSGCALTEDQIDIPYKVQGGAQTGAGINVTTAVQDARTADRTKVSAKMNGYGMEMAAIRAKREVTLIVKDAFDGELKARGYSLEPGGRTATIAVKRFYNNFKTGIFSGDALADVDLGVTVTAPGGATVYQRDIAVEGKVANIQITGGSNASEALSDGLTKAFAALFADEAFITALRPDAPAAAAAPAAPAEAPAPATN